MTFTAICEEIMKPLHQPQTIWAGFPVPRPGSPALVLDVRHPLRGYIERVSQRGDSAAARRALATTRIEQMLNDQRPADMRRTYSHSWWSERLVSWIHVAVTASGRVVLADAPEHRERLWVERIELLARTFSAAQRLTIGMERRAQRRLRAVVTRRQWRSYVVSGEFSERSPRSGVTYWFRRLRPTLAVTMRAKAQVLHRAVGIRTALCSHGVAYHSESFTGVLAPTDDVLSHLLLMRADEPRLWRVATQHTLADPRSGV